MGYTLKKKLANKSNYGGKRSKNKIKYIVIHYTGNDGDTDEDNGKYFANNKVKASAHYFVDDDSITQSVPDDYVAYSVGGSRYSNYKTTGGAEFYGKANNTNTLNIELCDDVKNGSVYPSAGTIANAIAFTKKKMKEYNIPDSCVIRHFDITGKSCPAYWTSNSKWKKEFHDKLTGGSTSGSTPKNPSKPAGKEFKVKTKTKMAVRKGPGTLNKKVMDAPAGVYTITETRYNGKTPWGRLKSGAGWMSIHSKYCERV